jgi:hypothetical protein
MSEGSHLPAIRLECLRLAVQLLPYARDSSPPPESQFLNRKQPNPEVETAEQRVKEIALSLAVFVLTGETN